MNFEESKRIMTSLLEATGFIYNEPKSGIPLQPAYVGLYAKGQEPDARHTILQMVRIFPDIETADAVDAFQSLKTFTAFTKIAISKKTEITATPKVIVAFLDQYFIVIVSDEPFDETAKQNLVFRIVLIVWQHNLVSLNVNQNNGAIVAEFFEKLKITDPVIVKLFLEAPNKKWKSETEQKLLGQKNEIAG